MPHTDKRAPLHKTRGQGQELSKRQAAPVALSSSPHCSAPRRPAHLKDPRTPSTRREPVARQPPSSIHSAAATPPRRRANRAPRPPASPRPGPAPRLPPRRQQGPPLPAHPRRHLSNKKPPLRLGVRRQQPRLGAGLGAARGRVRLSTPHPETLSAEVEPEVRLVLRGLPGQTGSAAERNGNK